jgi:mannose-1-phosphate guanylyltransferase
MILAAGFGTRLRPLTDSIPKPLIDVAGHPMIAYPIALLRAAGITEIIVNLHHLGSQIRSTLGDGSAYGVSLTYSEEDAILETGGGIKKAEPFLRGGPFVVVNADTVIDLCIADVVRWHQQRGALATMVLRADPEAERYGKIEIDGDGRIRRFLGHPADVDGPLRSFMFTGVHVFDPKVFRYMGEGHFSITRVTYPAMLAAGAPLYGYVFDGHWHVLDTPAGLAEGRRDLERGATLARQNAP